MEKIVDHVTPKERRKFQSSFESILTRMLDEAGHDLARLTTILVNPRRMSTEAVPGAELLKRMATKVVSPGSLFQDHEQYIEDNVMPFQEITIHPESAVPEGSQAFDTKSVMKTLDLNKTMDGVELGLLLADEVVMEKKLKLMARLLMPPKRQPIK